MSKLFELKKPEQTPEEIQRVEELAIEAAKLDADSEKLSSALGAQRGVEAIKYTKVQRGKWVLEHARVGNDCVIQLFALREPMATWQSLMTVFISVMDRIFPKSTQIYYRPPSKVFEISFFTITIAGLYALPGWQRALEKAIDGLMSVDAWTRPTS